MINEVLTYLQPKGLIVDATLGGGGHAKAILSSNSKVKLIGIDQDDDAQSKAKETLKEFGDRVTYIKDNFSNIKTILGENKIDGILLDLGVSSYQIDTKDRGFSFQTDAPLDMRMSNMTQITAKDIINNSCSEELEHIIRDYGEERFYKKIVRNLISKRPIETTRQLENIVKYSIPKINPINTTKSIARVFQAFRIAVNSELDVLEMVLNNSIDLLKPGGRIVVMSYHSLEDRIVKETFKQESTKCICPPKQPVCTCKHIQKLKILTKKPVTAGDDEIRINPRARSAKLRAAEKI